MQKRKIKMSSLSYKIKLVCPRSWFDTHCQICYTDSSEKPISSLFAHGSCLEHLHYVRPKCSCQRNGPFCTAKLQLVHFPAPRTGIMKYMVRVPHGKCNSVLHTWQSETWISFLESKEHDLFALLFLSDLIGHYPHIHISDICSKEVKYYPQWFRNRYVCPWSDVFFTFKLWAQDCASRIKTRVTPRPI